MKKLLCFALATMLCLSSISAFADVEGSVQGDIMLTSVEGEAAAETATETKTEPEGITFTDVVAGSVLGDAVNKLVEKNILAGYPDGTFRPDNGLTRAELSKIINLVFNLTEKSSSVPFTDVKTSEWYYDYVSVAVKAGYIKGFQDNTFRGDDPVTREQVCAILNRVTKEQGMGLFDLPFTDNIMDEVSDWALEDVKKIIANYVMPLESDGRFRATENITRAELVLAVENFIIEIPKFTVTFEVNGGEEMENALVEQGKALTKPADPVKKNNTFGGWYTDKNFKKAYDFATTVTEDITLYAKWTPNSTAAVGTGGGGSYTPSTPEPTPTPGVTNYKITFNSKGGSEVAAQYVPSGECATMPEEPIKEWYIFAGWFKDSALEEEFDFSEPVTKNMTLYAKWEEDTAALTAQRVADLKVIKEVMGGANFENFLFVDVLDLTLDTIDLVIADGENGIDISGNYVADAYGAEISEAKDIYDSVMNETERNEFKAAVVEMIAECQLRGIKMTLGELWRYFIVF